MLTDGNLTEAPVSQPKLLDSWYYQPQVGPGLFGQEIGPFTAGELAERLQQGEIQPDTRIWQKGAQSLYPLYAVVLVGPPTSPTAEEFVKHRARCRSTILSGPNNSGKSLVLKRIGQELGADAHMLGCARFYQVDNLSGEGRNDEKLKTDTHHAFLRESAGLTNSENNHIDLNQLLVRLNNRDREKLFDLCGETIGGKFSLKANDPENDFSHKYVDIDGKRLRVASTGTRIIMTIFATCLDPRFHTLLIDEPEIGLSPRAQSTLARYLLDTEDRSKWFPHLQHVYIATHSHLFLDRRCVTNNFAISNSAGSIVIRQVDTLADYHQLQFNMLGNDLESLFLPSAIVMVEGPSDYVVLDRSFKIRYPAKRITVINADTESEMPTKMKLMADIFEGIKTSPYRQRIFFALDSVITAGRRGTREKLISQGADPANIIQWSKNGIEHYYPEDALREIFHCGEGAAEELKIAGDLVTVNGITHTKVELRKLVASKLHASSKFGDEVEKFFDRVGSAGDPTPPTTGGLAK